MIIKSLLRYPGGKSRGMAKILPHFEDETTIISPFFGGGVIEIALARQGVKVYAYDVMKPLVNFWSWVQKDPKLLADTVDEIGWVERDTYYQIRKGLCESKCEDVTSAGLFFVLNRISFGGIFASGYSYHAVKRDDVPRGAEKIRHFDFPSTLTLGHEDFETTLERHPHEFLYCDPPYINAKTSLYGLRGELHRNFKHERLRQALIKRDRWILSYGDCEKVREMYRGKRMIEMVWRYGKNGKQGKELLIFGDGVALHDELPLFRSNHVLYLP